ncbi:ATP-GRASP peptide maturase of grasp-with-spasm system [Chryseobacterium sp. CBTAP 102]|uniref:grasp-with-spasm system ATP-grasp peptide maturase n=1 Tax=unclassified Chryseobacterium TaxID=2593645 RepID=UPI000953B278|nr:MULTISPECIES: grasp-with-spasm system ATP-grasp peptide maturase [unclassified Chryseobacterium]PXW12561.1 ATP-GRASP peptide maturase of grasp-with-spasm system [Chryseobacterium sp. CBTAP 102]SIQ82689.1 ATP-GRASP peptide maturase, grasp-with-spasm system [Chryseobacterium sp. RU33C]
MILIISNNNERTTNKIIEWLLEMKKEFIRIHEDEIFEIAVENKKILLRSNRNSFFLDKITSVWYRRGGLKIKRLNYENPSVNAHMNEVQHWLEDYVRTILESKKHINKESNSDVNKLLVLEEAKKIGLEIPEYFLADNTDQVSLDKTIVKTIGGNPILDDIDTDLNGIMYTSVVHKREKTKFFITFFQDRIDKEFEIRTFYLNGKCHSMAIFSQNDEQTKTDFRKYNLEKPNRNVPYKLSSDIEEKIKLLMNSLDLNCGSLDFIKGKDGKFYFLEVNTIGQFLGLSRTCNYSVDKKIADYL